MCNQKATLHILIMKRAMKNLYLLMLCLIALQAKAQYSFHQDCSTAIPLCNGRYIFPFGFDGAGDTSELQNGATCLTYGEQNSSWFKLTFDGPGNLAFVIEPLGQDDYDFAVFDITGQSCQVVQDSLPPVVRCNYAITNGLPSGINNQATDTTAGLNGQPFLQWIAVDSGDVIMLLITSSSSFTSGFTLDFSGTTANMVADEPLIIAESFTAICENTLYTELFFSQPIDSNSIANDFSDFELFDNLGNVLTVQQMFMDSAVNRIIIICERPAYVIDSIFIVSKIGTDGSTVKATCSNQQIAATDTIAHRYLYNQMGTPGFTVSNIGRRHSFQANVSNVAFVDWYYNGSFYVRKQASEPLVANLDAGESYTICMVAELGCNRDSTCQTVTYTGLEDFGIAGPRIYPNPANKLINIELPQVATITVVDIYGKSVFMATGRNAYVLATDAWASGIYLITTTSGTSVYQGRIIISH